MPRRYGVEPGSIDDGFHVKEHGSTGAVVFQNAKEIVGRSLNFELGVVGEDVVFGKAKPGVQGGGSCLLAA